MASNDDLKAAAQKELLRRQAQAELDRRVQSGSSPAPMGTAEDSALSLTTGTREGFEGIGGFMGDAANMQGGAASWLAGLFGASPETQASVKKWGSRLHPGGIFPSTGQIREAVTDPLVKKAGMEDLLAHKPQTMTGEYFRTAGRFAPNLLSPGSIPQRLATTFVPAIASETAGQFTKGTSLEPWARAGAGVLAGLGAGLATAPRSSSSAIANAVEGATPQQLDQAEQLFQEAQAAGAPITRMEAIQQVTQNGTRAADLQRVVEGQGGLRDFMGARPGQVEVSGRGQIDQIAPVPAAPSSIGPQAAETAGGVINDTRQAINTATEPLYTAAAPQRIDPATFARIQATPGWAEASAAVRGNPQLARYVNGLPDDSVGFANEVQKYLRQQSENAAGPMNAARNQQISAGYGTDAGAVRGAAEAASPDYQAALATQARLRETYLDPLLQGPIGRLAKDDTTTQQAIEALFPRNPVPNSEQEITAAVGQLAARRPDVARQLVRAHIESVFNQATKDLQAGANQFGGASFVSQLRGNSQQAANLEAAVRALPNGDTLWEGFDRYLTILEAQGTRQRIGSQTAFNQEALQALRGGGPAEAVGKVAAGGLIKFPAKVMETIERWRLGRNVNAIADIITNPQSAQLFRGLAQATTRNTARNIAIGITLAGDAATRRRLPLEITVGRPATQPAQ